MTHITSHATTQFSSLLCSPGLVASPQVVDVDDESSFVLADHVPDFALVNPLVLLQIRQENEQSVCVCSFKPNTFRR